MQNLAKKLDSTVYEETGTVVAKDGGRFVVRVSSGELRARRAVSCLVEPEPGDLALVASTPHEAYVLAVLEREEGAAATLVAEGDLKVHVPNGRFGVAAQKGLDLASSGDVEVVSAGVKVNTVEANVVVDSLSMVGSFMRAEIQRVKLLATTFDATIERLSQRLKRSTRHVEEVDQVRADQIDYEAENLLALRGANAVVTAKELVKVDGEQIHVG